MSIYPTRLAKNLALLDTNRIRDESGLKILRRKACGFDSRRPHQIRRLGRWPPARRDRSKAAARRAPLAAGHPDAHRLEMLAQNSRRGAAGAEANATTSTPNAGGGVGAAGGWTSAATGAANRTGNNGAGPSNANGGAARVGAAPANGGPGALSTP